MITSEVVDGVEYLNYHNGTRMGEIYAEIDGYYVFVPDCSRRGFWSAESLRGIADFLDERNREWNAKIKKVLG